MLEARIAPARSNRREVEKSRRAPRRLLRAGRVRRSPTAANTSATCRRSTPSTAASSNSCDPDVAPSPSRCSIGSNAAFAGCRNGLIEARIDSGFIVEGHGDLRPEHVCLDGTPLDHRLPRVQPAHAASSIPTTKWPISVWSARCSGPGGSGRFSSPCFPNGSAIRPAARLLAFYALFRCLLRARLSMAHLLEAERPDAGKMEAACPDLSVDRRPREASVFHAQQLARSSRCRREA